MSPPGHNSPLPRRSVRAHLAGICRSNTLEATTDSAVITWDEAVDDGGVASYDIVVNGELHKTVAANVTLTVITGLTPASQVIVSIFARDLTGNLSNESIGLTFTTGERRPNVANGVMIEVMAMAPDEVGIAWGAQR